MDRRFRLPARRTVSGATVACGLLVIALAATSVPAAEKWARGGTPDGAFFASDFEDGTLFPWDNFDLGAGATPVASTPRGGITPGIVRVTRAAAAKGTRGVELTVTRDAHASPSSGTNSVYLWNRVRPEFGHDGQETWERFRVRFPRPSPGSRGSSGPVFRPNENCHAGCPWFVEHHNDDSYLPFYRAGLITWEYATLVWGVDTSRRIGRRGGRVPQIVMRVWGGENNTPAEPTRSEPVWVNANAPLKYNHWYTFLVHVRWSPDRDRALVEWWLDGRLVFSGRTPTLWRHPDGSISSANFELVNYRRSTPLSSTIFFDDLRIGPTLASVDG